MDTLLLTLPYYLVVLASWGTAGIFVIAVRKRIRPREWLILTLAFTALGLAYFLIAATAAPGGHVSRGAVAGPIRWLYLVGGVCWLLWLVRFVRSMVSVRRRNDST